MVLKHLKLNPGNHSTFIYVNDLHMKKKESNEIMNWVKKFEISQFIAIGANLEPIKSQLRPNDFSLTT